MTGRLTARCMELFDWRKGYHSRKGFFAEAPAFVYELVKVTWQTGAQGFAAALKYVSSSLARLGGVCLPCHTIPSSTSEELGGV